MQIRMRTFIALVAVAVTICALWFTNRAVTPRVATWEDVQAEARSGGYSLITTEELAEVYRKDPGAVLLVDTRQEWEFRSGHMKGSLNFPMEPTWWSRWRKAPALEEFLGPDKERMIVFY